MADYLEAGKREAIRMMGDVPARAEINIGRLDNRLVWLGFGWLAAKGWVTYQGGYCFSWAKNGRESARQYLAN